MADYDKNDSAGQLGRGAGRYDFLFATAFVTIIAALVVPLRGHVLDIVLIFSLSLTLGIVAITFSARRILQVSGFPLLIVLATAVRLFTALAGARRIVTAADTGRIIDSVGQAAGSENSVAFSLAVSVLVIICLVVVLWTVRWIRRFAKEKIEIETPLKQMALQSEVSAGVLTFDDAQTVGADIEREAGFLRAFSATAGFVVVDAIVEPFIFAFAAAGAALQAQSLLPSAQHWSPAAALALICQAKLVMMTLACWVILRRALLTKVGDEAISDSYKDKYSRIKVEASQVEADKMENDGLEKPDAMANDSKVPLWNAVVLGDNSQDDYQATINMLRQGGDKTRIVMAAALGTEDLPVTVAVNLAVSLADQSGKTLLVDMDIKRDSVSKVFDIKAESDRLRPIRSGVENLSLWPAGNFKGNAKYLSKVLTQLRHRYRHIIIYAPSLDDSFQKRHLEGVNAAMIFGNNPKEKRYNRLKKLLSEAGIQILKPPRKQPR